MSTADPLDRFRAHAIGDAGLQQRLAAIGDHALFLATVVAEAGALGIALDPMMVEPALRPDPLGLGRFDGAPATGHGWPGRGWLPTAIVPTSDGPAVDWTYFAGERLTRPFFEDSLREARRRPFNHLMRYRTPLSALASGAPEEAMAAPDGLVFHMSRCGSTLVSQMFAAADEHVVISEAPPLDAVVQFAYTRSDLPIADRIALLRAMVGALGRDAAGNGRRMIVKLDSWHTLALPLFRLAFPQTAWVYLYRDPVEVLVSHMRMRGLQTVCGAMGDLYGIEDGMEMPAEEYSARVLARICEGVLEHHSLGGGLLIDYRALPSAVEAEILPHFGIDPSPRARSSMRAASERHSKANASPFVPDTEHKQGEASASLRAAAAAHLSIPYRRLEELRLSGTVMA